MDKKSREQFERRTHKRALTTPQLTELELRWLLDAVKGYDFPGVQVSLAISTRSPAPAADFRPEAAGADAAAGGGAHVLAAHRRKHADLFAEPAPR